MGENHLDIIESANAWHLSIRYEGGDAASHTIDLHQLGQSLQGLARVLAVSAHFAQTGKYNKQFATLTVRVLAMPTREHHCYEVSASVMKVMASGELWYGLGTALFMAVVGYVFNRTKEQELKHLGAALQQALEQQAQTQARLFVTIERLVDALQPSVQQALAPIGQSVASINIRAAGPDGASVCLDARTKAEALAAKNSRFMPAQVFEVVISELGMLNGSCKVALVRDPENRIPAAITDPVRSQPGNAYATAMSHLQPIRVIAKAEIDKEDALVRLFISDLAEN